MLLLLVWSPTRCFSVTMGWLVRRSGALSLFTVISCVDEISSTKTKELPLSLIFPFWYQHSFFDININRQSWESVPLCPRVYEGESILLCSSSRSPCWRGSPPLEAKRWNLLRMPLAPQTLSAKERFFRGLNSTLSSNQWNRTHHQKTSAPGNRHCFVSI